MTGLTPTQATVEAAGGVESPVEPTGENWVLRDEHRGDRCWTWKGEENLWQEQAAMDLIESGAYVDPWSWLETKCGTKNCLNVEHILIRSPQRLDYPASNCVYCGVRSGTRDHLLPLALTGHAARRHVLTVPACTECNSLISDRYAPSITERRRIATAGLRKKYRNKLRVHFYSDEEIAEFGPGLRPFIERAITDRETIERRLAFPEDPTFDLRYLAKSGIEDPYIFGLLESGGA